MTKPRVIYWFRTDLRLHDSPALKAALDLEPECLYPIWTWDPHYVYRARVGPNRWQFLLDCQSDLSASITKINKKSKLFVIREAPTTLLPKLFKAWNISHLVFEKDTDAYARDRDNHVTELAKKAGVKVITKVGRTLYDPDELVKQNHGKPTMSITQVQKAGEIIGQISRPIAAPKSLPDPGEAKLEFDQDAPSSDPDINAIQRKRADNSYAHLAGPKGDFSVPEYDELGLKPATTSHRGGESAALAALDKIISNTRYTATFEKPATAPTAFEPQSTTLLSPHLHFGSLSCREFYWGVQDVVDNYTQGTASHPPTSLTGQLLFRDMYFGAQAALGHKFGQAYGNPACRFVPWHLPSKIDPQTGLVKRGGGSSKEGEGEGDGEYSIDSNEAESWFQRWKYGCTGFPWIDALMRQLRQEGWIHHLGRHAVACFLTRGGCYVDWERGAAVFEEWLIDHEPACNIGNWQWLSCTAFYAQFYRCYSPIAFPQKWDKDGAFVRKYVPELAKFPAKYIYEPWKAPIADQKAAGCEVKNIEHDDDNGGLDLSWWKTEILADKFNVDRANGANGDKGAGSKGMDKGSMAMYPKPMFDFASRRTTCINALKTAYQVGLHGDDKRVLDGSWRELFADDAEGPTSAADVQAMNDADADGEFVQHNDDDDDDDDDAQGHEDRSVHGNGHLSSEKKRKGHAQGTLDGVVKRTKV